jgi:hypothetical protein
MSKRVAYRLSVPKLGGEDCNGVIYVRQNMGCVKRDLVLFSRIFVLFVKIAPVGEIGYH